MEELAKRLGELADQYGPHVVEAARSAARVEAWSALRSHAIEAVVAVLLVRIALWAWRKDACDDDLDIPYGRISAGVLFFVAGVTGICAIAGFTDPWLWISMQNPDLWIAKRILKL